MSGPFGSSQWMYASGGFYNGVATQSLRFDDGSSAYLTRTPSSASNRKTWTWSGWVKRGNLGINTRILGTSYTSSSEFYIRFKSNETLEYGSYEGGGASNNFSLITTQVFRDVSAWYHIVFRWDTTQSTAANRLRIYVNGEQITAFSTANYPSQNYDGIWNNTVNEHRIGYGSSGEPFDGYMAEVNFIDGTSLDPTSFGETKNGVWIPIEYTGSYGTNGFRLQFNQTGTGTASSSTIGADTSGNTNHWTSSGIVASDCDMPDSPENNFATLNVLQQFGSGGAVAEGNLQYENTSTGAASSVQATMGVSSGKWYFETVITSASSEYIVIGWDKEDDLSTQGAGTDNSNAVGTGWSLFQSAILVQNVQVQTSVGTATQNDIVGCTIDLDSATRQVKWYKNNSLIATQNILSTGYTHMLPMVSDLSFIGTPQMVLNFGQDSSFAGNKTAQGNTDANGIGDFYYSPPSGYLALCTANLPEPTISPNADEQADDYFNTVLYNGTGSTQTINTGFSTDFTWIKSRSTANSHLLADSIRGSTKVLLSNDTNAEITDSNYTTFVSNGFSVSGNGNEINNSSGTYVSWNWKAGGTAVSNTDGSITSSVSANTDAGFSIVNWVGNATAGATVGHGLNQAPEMIITKYRDGVTSWGVYHSALGGTKLLNLDNTNAAVTTTSAWNDTDPTSSVITLGTNASTNNPNMIAYCFAEVEGYSKFGIYTGSSAPVGQGTFVYLGFRPSLVILKDINGGSWGMFDATRNAFNVTNKHLTADTSDAEYSGDTNRDMDFLSNGFKLMNAYPSGLIYDNSARQYIYIAFAETPTKYSLGR